MAVALPPGVRRASMAPAVAQPDQGEIPLKMKTHLAGVDIFLLEIFIGRAVEMRTVTTGHRKIFDKP